jgi:hypothetical protein
MGCAMRALKNRKYLRYRSAWTKVLADYMAMGLYSNVSEIIADIVCGENEICIKSF